MEPDWDALRRIAVEAERESRLPGWNQVTWLKLLERAKKATNGNPQLTEFMAAYMPE
jgi:hypothetical protein